MSTLSDPRLFVDDRNKKVFVSNLKCGYSTINQFYKRLGINVSNEINASHKNEGYECIVFVRDPLSRFKSFYKNWIVNKSFDNSYSNKYLFNLLQSSLPYEFFEHLVCSEPSEKSKSEFFNSFFEYFADHLHKDRHTVEQHVLVKKVQCYFDSNVALLDFKLNKDYLHKIYHATAEVQNKTGSEALEVELKDENLEYFKKLYAEDFKLHSASSKDIV